MKAEAFSIQTSSLLAFMLAMATVVAFWHVVSKREEWRIMAIFLLIAGGGAEREFVTALAGPGYWSPTVFMWSAQSKWLVIIGAVMFVWNFTRDICGPWAAVSFFLLSAFLALVVP